MEPGHVRSIAMIIALLAAGKLGYQEYAYRITLADVVMTTYRQDAVVACQREAAQRNLSVSYVSWTKPEEMSLEVGRSGSDTNAAGVVNHCPFEDLCPSAARAASYSPGSLTRIATRS